jgi:hypothetical protein
VEKNEYRSGALEFDFCLSEGVVVGGVVSVHKITEIPTNTDVLKMSKINSKCRVRYSSISV